MSNDATSAPSCLSSFSLRSRSNALGPSASSNVSTLYVRSWGALALGVICGCVTAFVVFEDVARNGAPITTDHVLTAAVIAIAASTGHMWWRRLWSSAFLVGLGLLFLFGSSLVYLVIASGGRNAEVAANKRHASHFANAERERIRPLMAIEQERKRKTQDKLQADCVEGKKGKGHCDGLRTTLSVYTMAVKGYEADLEKLGPDQEENGMLKATARLIIALKGIPTAEQEAAEKSYVERLEVILPYLKALLVEAATVVFLGVAFGHRSAQNHSTGTVPRAGATPQRTVRRTASAIAPRGTVRPETVPQSATVLRPNFRRTVRAGTVSLTQDEALERLLATIVSNAGTVPQDDLMGMFHVGAKSTVSRWCGEWEAQGFITRRQAGRCKIISASNGGASSSDIARA